MSIIGYSTCRMQFIPNDQQNPQRTYSDRLIVELRQHDNVTDYSIRAIDVENNKAEIFDCHIKDGNQYRFGTSFDQPDEISDSNGTYRIWLSGDARKVFHETLHIIVDMLFPGIQPKMTLQNVSQNQATTDSNPINKATISHPADSEVKDMLINIRNLSRSIKQGHADEAAQFIKQLTSRGVRIQEDSLKQFQNEEEFQILVQFDGNEYGLDQNGRTIPVKVFPSTTIRELRATFELAYHYPPINQYFFVNGHFATDDSTMTDLKAGLNSLFVLFVISHPKT